MAINLGTPYTLVSTSFTINNVHNITWSGWSIGFADITVKSDSQKQFAMHDDYDPGEITITGLLDHGTASNVPVVGTAAESWTLSDGGGTPETFICTGFITNFDMGFPQKEGNTYSITIKLTGAVTGTWSA